MKFRVYEVHQTTNKERFLAFFVDPTDAHIFVYNKNCARGGRNVRFEVREYPDYFITEAGTVIPAAMNLVFEEGGMN